MLTYTSHILYTHETKPGSGFFHLMWHFEKHKAFQILVKGKLTAIIGIKFDTWVITHCTIPLDVPPI